MRQTELFEEAERGEAEIYAGNVDGNGALEALPGLDDLFELSVEAYSTALHARMSELPIEGEIARFIGKVRAAGTCAETRGQFSADSKYAAVEARGAAGRAAFDRGDPDVEAVMNAAWKVRVEIHRLTGLLRFSPDSRGVYTARCAPDHCVLPALAEHFTLRFGEIPWAIIDEKRDLCLYRGKDGETRLVPLDAAAGALNGAPSTDASVAAQEARDANSLLEASFSTPPLPSGTQPDAASPEARDPDPEESGGWEDLWRLYHRSINNESRSNPRLQRRFMPERYHKYLTELT